MRMKYFQTIADIQDYFKTILWNFEDERYKKYGRSLLDSWEIDISDKDDIIEEKEALDYLIACQYNFTHDDRTIVKPSIEVMNRCLERHLKFLENTFGCTAYTVNKLRSNLVKKEYKACRHYLFKFSLPAWYAKMPEEIKPLNSRFSQ